MACVIKTETTSMGMQANGMFISELSNDNLQILCVLVVRGLLSLAKPSCEWLANDQDTAGFIPFPLLGKPDQAAPTCNLCHSACLIEELHS